MFLEIISCILNFPILMELLHTYEIFSSLGTFTKPKDFLCVLIKLFWVIKSFPYWSKLTGLLLLAHGHGIFPYFWNYSMDMENWISIWICKNFPCLCNFLKFVKFFHTYATFSYTCNFSLLAEFFRPMEFFHCYRLS